MISRSFLPIKSQKLRKINMFKITVSFRYLYLIFSDDDLISLDEFVLNTEAHPIRIQRWGDDQKSMVQSILQNYLRVTRGRPGHVKIPSPYHVLVKFSVLISVRWGEDVSIFPYILEILSKFKYVWQYLKI